MSPLAMQLDGGTVVTLVCTAFGALISFIATLLLYRFKQIEQAIDKIRADMHIEGGEIRTLISTLQGKTEIMSDRTTDWRESALKTFAMKEDVIKGWGSEIATAINEHARTLINRREP